MAEITQEQINQARMELEQATREMSDALADRERYEKQAKSVRSDANKQAAELEELSRQSDTIYRAKKQAVEALNATLRHAVVAKTVDDSARAQKQNEMKSAELVERVTKKEQELDSMLAQVKSELEAAKKLREKAETATKTK